jgi:hypothetical protein
MPPQALFDAMDKYVAKSLKSGALIDTGGLAPTKDGFRIRMSRGKLKATDGPFTETKEVVGGYAIINVKSKAEAIELTKKFLKVAGGGESEVREMHDQAAYDARAANQFGGATQSRAAEATR